MIECDNPVFIVGTERSGSNLLRMILNSHSQLVVPHPPHILKYFSKFENLYKQNYSEHSVAKLTDDVLALIDTHIYPWEISLDREELVAKSMKGPSLLYLFVQIYNQYLAQTEKNRWVCKSTFVIKYIDDILEIYPQAQFIFLVRDPRDVVVSSTKSVFNPFHPYFTAKLWKQQQQEGMAALTHLKPENIFKLKYEELVSKPKGVVEDLCAFLSVEFETEMLSYHKSDEARKSQSLSESWVNTGRPIIAENFNKFRKELTQSEIYLVESICRNEMKFFGYKLEAYDEERGELKFSKSDIFFYKVSNLFSHVVVEIKSLFKDKNHFRRWGRTYLILSIELRLRVLSWLKR